MEKIRTNHIKVHFLWDKFLGDFDLYKIEYSNAYDFGNNLAYIIHSGFISGYQNRYGDNLKPPTNVYHRMTA